MTVCRAACVHGNDGQVQGSPWHSGSAAVYWGTLAELGTLWGTLAEQGPPYGRVGDTCTERAVSTLRTGKYACHEDRSVNSEFDKIDSFRMLVRGGAIANVELFSTLGPPQSSPADPRDSGAGASM